MFASCLDEWSVWITLWKYCFTSPSCNCLPLIISVHGWVHPITHQPTTFISLVICMQKDWDYSLEELLTCRKIAHNDYKLSPCLRQKLLKLIGIHSWSILLMRCQKRCSYVSSFSSSQPPKTSTPLLVKWTGAWYIHKQCQTHTCWKRLCHGFIWNTVSGLCNEIC